MKTFFVSIYKFFAQHRVIFYATLVASLVLLSVIASDVKIDENLTSFFPKGMDSRTEFVMKHQKALDKVVVIVSLPDTSDADVYDMIDAAEAYADSLTTVMGDAVSISLYYDDTTEDEMMGEVQKNMRLLLTDDDFGEMDIVTSDSAISARMKQNKDLMMSPLSTGLKRILAFDPLGLSTRALMSLRSLADNEQLTLTDGYLMDREQRNLMMTIELPEGFEKTGSNTQTVSEIRSIAQEKARLSGLDFYVYGAPLVAVANSERVKQDECLTMSVAVVLIVVVLTLVFRRKRTLVLVIAPVIFGGLFALAGVSLIGQPLSLMAIGAGAAVLGVALSYSIHMLTHNLHTHSIEELIADMAYPMTVGSITTIGAFVGLIFTNSKLLSDLGIFASLALVGTLVFSLIFLPHFIKAEEHETRSGTMTWIERAAGYDYSRNRWLVGGLAVLTIVCLFCFSDVRFDGDMTKLNYRGDEWLEASEKKLTEISGFDGNRASLTVVGETLPEVLNNAAHLASQCDAMIGKGIRSYSTIAPTLLKSDSLQRHNIDKWQTYWTEEKKAHVISTLRAEAQKNGFAATAFEAFEQMIETECSLDTITADEVLESPIYATWFAEVDGVLMMNFNLELDPTESDEVLAALDTEQGVVVTDMGYHVKKATSVIVDDFNTILIISSLLVALALLLSYGRVELFVMTFLPMTISWVIILGLMALFGVEFNFVNIILSTFIFGVGDDFSIFIMDGLLSEYRDKKKILTSHKTAIALSAFAVVGGLGAHVFAQHPAVRSIGLLSIFGLVAVILTSYIVQPVLFRLFISDATQKGSPWTVKALIRTTFYYGYFALAYLMCIVLMGVLFCVPMGKWRRKLIVRKFICGFMRSAHWLLAHYYTLLRRDKLDLAEPRIIIANHQSLVDISLFLAADPKIVFVTKTWVNRLPLIGPLVNYCGFCSTGEGTDQMEQSLKEYVEHGYSVVIFPEGTRTEDGEIHRFHKGAFQLAADFGLKILPVLFYGNGNMLSKHQPMRFHRTQMLMVSLPLVDINDASLGDTLRDKVHAVQSMMRASFDSLRREYVDAKEVNPYYRELISNSLIYKSAKARKFVVSELKHNHLYDDIAKSIYTTHHDANVVVLDQKNSPQAMLLTCYLALYSRRKVVYCNECATPDDSLYLSDFMNKLRSVEVCVGESLSIGERLKADDYLITCNSHSPQSSVVRQSDRRFEIADIINPKRKDHE